MTAQAIPFPQIATDIGLTETQVFSWVTHSRPYPDGSGYRVFFRVETPTEVRERVPRLTPTNMLIVLST